jgi:hypothetical protein
LNGTEGMLAFGVLGLHRALAFVLFGPRSTSYARTLGKSLRPATLQSCSKARRSWPATATTSATRFRTPIACAALHRCTGRAGRV